MEKLIEVLRDIGFPADECERIRKYYEGDDNGLRHYVAYVRALFDDRHEYLD